MFWHEAGTQDVKEVVDIGNTALIVPFWKILSLHVACMGRICQVKQFINKASEPIVRCVMSYFACALVLLRNASCVRRAFGSSVVAFELCLENTSRFNLGSHPSRLHSQQVLPLVSWQAHYCCAFATGVTHCVPCSCIGASVCPSVLSRSQLCFSGSFSVSVLKPCCRCCCHPSEETKSLGYSVAQVTGDSMQVAKVQDLIDEKIRRVNPTGSGLSHAPPAATAHALPAPSAAAAALDVQSLAQQLVSAIGRATTQPGIQREVQPAIDGLLDTLAKSGVHLNGRPSPGPLVESHHFSPWKLKDKQANRAQIPHFEGRCFACFGMRVFSFVGMYQCEWMRFVYVAGIVRWRNEPRRCDPQTEPQGPHWSQRPLRSVHFRRHGSATNINFQHDGSHFHSLDTLIRNHEDEHEPMPSM